MNDEKTSLKTRQRALRALIKRREERITELKADIWRAGTELHTIGLQLHGMRGMKRRKRE